MSVLNKLKELLGYLSSYKEKYEKEKTKCEQLEKELSEIEKLVDEYYDQYIKQT